MNPRSCRFSFRNLRLQRINASRLVVTPPSSQGTQRSGCAADAQDGVVYSVGAEILGVDGVSQHDAVTATKNNYTHKYK